MTGPPTQSNNLLGWVTEPTTAPTQRVYCRDCRHLVARPGRTDGFALDRKTVATEIRQLTPEEQRDFDHDGFVVVRKMASPETCGELLAVIRDELQKPEGPLEYEADLGYPGAPSNREANGGATLRRLQQAFNRHPLFAGWAANPNLLSCVSQLVGPDLVLPLAHHNCVMTKQPRFSSRTAWHQDFRYWSFQRPELVSAWLALGPETAENGALEVVPGSHAMTLDTGRFDPNKFFREDLPENQDLLDSRRLITLEVGDVLLFHCLTLHSAGPNHTDATKCSLVFTYRPADNPPAPGSRSASIPEVPQAPASPEPSGSSPEDRS